MTDWVDIDLAVRVAIKLPITFEMGRAWYNNPIAIAEGAPGAPRVAIDVNSQTALATDETARDRVLRPDGSGSVEWGPEGSIHTAYIDVRGMEYNVDQAGYVGSTTDNGSTAGTTIGSNRIALAAGIFTVEDEGVYLIRYTWETSGIGRNIELRRNGTLPAGFPSGTSEDGFFPTKLNAGDTIGLYVTHFDTGALVTDASLWMAKV